MPALRRIAFALAVSGVCACRVGGWVANVVGDVVGATGDAYCDRRFVSGAEEKPASFCQEILDTVAVSEFQDDCREKHTARASEGRCDRGRLLGGCKLHKVNDDGSEVFDWFYDVADLEADGGTFEDPARTEDDVRTLCADPKRYEEGASFVAAPGALFEIEGDGRSARAQPPSARSSMDATTAE